MAARYVCGPRATRRLSRLCYVMLTSACLLTLVVLLKVHSDGKGGPPRSSERSGQDGGGIRSPAFSHQDPAFVRQADPSRVAGQQAPPANLTDRSQFLVTTGVSGKLGNQMFQYASLLGVAAMNRMTPIYPSAQLQSAFMVTHVVDRPTRDFHVVNEKDFASYDSTFESLPPQNTLIMQYFQSWKYFRSVEKVIRKEFRFKEHIQSAAHQLLSMHAAQVGNRTRVGIHVRQGDMNLLYHIRKGYHTAPASYIRKAMNYMRQKHPDVIFFVVSDDVRWCRANLMASDVILVDSATAEIHLAVLASCDHVIMTVGTYGWWGGYLCGGEVVYYWDPERLLHNPPLPVEIRHPEDLFLPQWVRMSG